MSKRPQGLHANARADRLLEEPAKPYASKAVVPVSDASKAVQAV